MFFGVWSWVLVVIVVAAIFYANKLPQMKEQALEKLQEGKVLFEKSKKELEAKANIIAEKTKEKHAAMKAEKKEEDIEEKTEITAEDLAFMPETTVDTEKSEEVQAETTDNSVSTEENTETPEN